MQRLLVDEWTPVIFYCENCKNLIEGYADSRGNLKVQCERCGVTYIKHILSPTRCSTEMFAPSGECMLCVSQSRKNKA